MQSEYVRYILDQLSGLPGVRCIPMMGGTIFYVRERVFGGIYDSGELMIKITEASRRYMPDSVPEPPLPGAKEMLPCTVLDDRETFRSMVEAMIPELPERKKRPRRNPPPRP